PLGGEVGRELAGMLAAEGTPLRAVPIEGETRVFVGVREGATGRSLLLNPRGPRLGPADAEALREAVRAELHEARPRWVACCGSLPPGLPPDLYAVIGRMARDSGARFVPDCDTPPLRMAVETGCDLLVPNHHEARRLLEWEFEEDDVAAAAGAATALLARGPAAVPAGCWGGGSGRRRSGRRRARRRPGPRAARPPSRARWAGPAPGSRPRAAPGTGPPRRSGTAAPSARATRFSPACWPPRRR